MPISKEKLLSLFNKNLYVPDISKKTNLSQSTIRYWANKYNITIPRLRKYPIVNNYKICTICKQNLHISEYHLRCKQNNIYRGNCKNCSKIKQQQKSYIHNKTYKLNILKQKLVTYKGSRCEICNLITNIYDLYEFHHKDPKQKDFTISSKRFFSLRKHKKEVDKCHLLCSNCHREVHGGLHPSFLKNTIITNNKICKSTKFCPTCKLNKPSVSFYSYKDECKECFRYRTNMRLRCIKQKCIDYKGGECEHCGYNKYIGAIDFHHIDPRKKDFRLSKNQKSFGESHKKELDKCICLCSNCHRKEHYRLRQLTKEERIAEYENKQSNTQTFSTDLGNIIVNTLSKTITINKNEYTNIIINERPTYNHCPDCNKRISKGAKMCIKCNNTHNNKKLRRTTRPPKEQLIKEIQESSFVAVGKKYGVSDNAIRKWLKTYGVNPKTVKKQK